VRHEQNIKRFAARYLADKATYTGGPLYSGIDRTLWESVLCFH